jgi:hypothetical protein
VLDQLICELIREKGDSLRREIFFKEIKRMRIAVFVVAVSAGTLGIGACSATVPTKGAGGPSGSVSSVREPTWTASIRGVNASRYIVPDSSRERSYGSARWSAGNPPTLSSVNLEFSYGGRERELSWAILYGACGTASLPVNPISTFPELEVGSSGRVEVNATLSVQLPTSGAYHIEIYRDRQGGTESVVACGNLKFGSG